MAEGHRSQSEEEKQERRKYKKGGRIIRYEPTNTIELMASPITVTIFKYMGCFEFCEKVERTQHHSELTRQFIINLHDNQETLASVTFTISSAIISAATGIPNVGEKWFKLGELDYCYYETYLKPNHKNERMRILPFSYLLDIYVPIMKIIMKYFTCEGKFLGSIPIIFGYSCILQNAQYALLSLSRYRQDVIHFLK